MTTLENRSVARLECEILEKDEIIRWMQTFTKFLTEARNLGFLLWLAEGGLRAEKNL